MKPLVARRWVALAWLAAASVLLVLGHRLYALGLQGPAFVTGWILAGLMLFLLLFNLRKKLPFLPLGAASDWTQAHIYLGLLSLVVFSLHSGLRLPSGMLESILALTYVVLALSGVVGVVVERRLPARLAGRGEPVIFERIPRLRVRLQERVEQLAEAALVTTGSATIADFYRRRLLVFFSGPRHLWLHLLNSGRPAQMLRRDIAAVQRYMSEDERTVMSDIEELALAKNELDFQHAGYVLLKGWLFVHIPLSYGILPLVLLHVVLVHAFGAGG
jgi:hypothetical protein